MTTLNLTPRLIPVVALRAPKAAFRAGVDWTRATPLERHALVTLRRVFLGKLTDAAAASWVTRYPAALAAATDAEARMLRMADCAVEVG